MYHPADSNWLRHRQNAITNARLFLQSAIAEIDRAFGPKYAETNPDLVAVFMEICARSCEDDSQGERHEQIIEMHHALNQQDLDEDLSL